VVEVALAKRFPGDFANFKATKNWLDYAQVIETLERSSKSERPMS
jgi:hypothetical protein